MRPCDDHQPVESGGTAANDEVLMLLADYVAQQCARHYVRRGHLPAALGLGNVNKALRRLDAFCAGRSPDADLLQRLRQCPLFEPAAIDAAMAATAAPPFTPPCTHAHALCPCGCRAPGRDAGWPGACTRNT